MNITTAHLTGLLAGPLSLLLALREDCPNQGPCVHFSTLRGFFTYQAVRNVLSSDADMKSYPLLRK